jgi:hypothetical protein
MFDLLLCVFKNLLEVSAFAFARLTCFHQPHRITGADADPHVLGGALRPPRRAIAVSAANEQGEP